MSHVRLAIPLLLLLVWVVVVTRPAVPAGRASVLTERAVPSLETAQVDSAPKSIDELRARIEAVLRREGVAGVGLALVDRDGVRWAGGVGVADRQTGVPVTGDTVFRVASITKSVVGLGVARLAWQGRLSLDEPLSRSLPELVIPNPWDAERPVTLAHALEHTAGFDDMRFNEWFSEDESMDPASALGINPRSRAVRWRPGSRMAYSNVGYTVAALAIERATGEPFDAWLSAEVLAPLGMGNAAFRRTPERMARLATGYVEPDRPAPFSPIAHRPAGALLASSAELGRLVHFWLRRGEGLPEIVPPAGLRRVEQTATLAAPPTDASYGLGNYGDVAHPVRARGHDGGLPGFLSCYRYFPELGVGYVMLLNGTFSSRAYGEIRALLFAHLTHGMRLPSPPSVRPDPARARDTGYYALANPRSELFGFLERAVVGFGVSPSLEGIWLSPLQGGSVELQASEPGGGYRHPLQSGTSVRLHRDDQGRATVTAGWIHAEPASFWAASLQFYLLGLTMVLLQLAPPLAVGWLVIRVIRRRWFSGAGLWLWPALAGLAMSSIPVLLSEASARDALGRVDVTTVGLCVATLVLALASTFGLASAVRAAVARDRISWVVRILPTLTSTLAVGLTLWLGAHGIIGLRTWAW
ncbi:serine hydrolase domain-containing protein [Paraliomyxa miuraensis]|uniref:serine hydrolase domain-containing protein n=1 Tax=Paraliomyxa miuraensis TaxID=376150 RepID=UPI00225AE1B4|nr:serine hydrolase domain-containing protein [Paraliomyxa miuraensis]MCX4245252.1 beta-lactamase family protein [Paraliomyxa miuraensis]